ncbi:MAG: hypothetical protein ACLFQ9_03335 [Desulfobacterales bacterium]
MIRYLFYLITVVFLVIVQTSIIPYMPGILKFYDFLVPFVVYLSLYKPLSHGLPVLAAAGLVMDMLSGAPIGIYLTTYLWVFLAFRRVARWVGIKDHLLFSLLAVLGVVFENLIFSVVLISSSPRVFFTLDSLELIFLQVLWTVVTAPFLWLAFKYCFGDHGRIEAR